MDAVELKVHRLNTTAFIDQRPSDITLQRPSTSNTPSGGKIEGTPTPVSNKPFRIIELSNAVNQFVTTTDGVARIVEFQLLGEWDANIAIGDYWREGVRDWLVADLARSNEYESRALVVERGK